MFYNTIKSKKSYGNYHQFMKKTLKKNGKRILSATVSVLNCKTHYLFVKDAFRE